MNRLLIILSIVLLLNISVFAQAPVRIGFLDMDWVLEQIDDYQEANNQLDAKIQEWRKEIELQQKQIDALEDALDLERPLLTNEIIEDREDDISYEQEQLNALKTKRFGTEGQWLAQKVILLQPVQDEILEAVKEVAENRKLDYVFDRSAEIITFHSEKKYDISTLVIRYIEQEDKKLAREALIESRKEEQRANNPAVENRRKAIEARKAEREKLLEERRNKAKNKRNNKKDVPSSSKEEELTGKKGTSTEVLPEKVDRKALAEQKKQERKKEIEQKKQERIKLLEERKKALEEKRKKSEESKSNKIKN